MNDVEEAKPSLKHGADVIRQFSKTLPATPGVYRMLSSSGEILYIGKAKALTKRVYSYTNVQKLPLRLQRMVALTASMEFINTHTEVEALLLESNLIKKHKPRFNILLRDDKSFPYIQITKDHDYPQIAKHRGAKRRKGEYFGPFASAGLVNRTIIAIQRAFQLRNCSDNVFANRSRPCLQYHIKRCTAPCVDYVSKDEYAAQVRDAENFLKGKSRDTQEKLAQRMQEASDAMEFERAASYRDRIRALTSIQSHQDINNAGVRDADVFSLAQKGGQSCIQVFFFRGGRNYGNNPYFPKHDEDDSASDIMAAFVTQFYENKPVPKDIIVNHPFEDMDLLGEALSEKAEYKVKCSHPQKGARRRLTDFAEQNAMNALSRRITEKSNEREYLEAVGRLFEMDDMPKRIEVYDNSHISGTNMVGAMIVAGPEGFDKKSYRKFNIRTAQESDDFGMMREVISRRFKKVLEEDFEPETDENWPDILLIDGGLGQYNAVKDILEEYGIENALKLVSIAKGVDRHAGRERFFVEGLESRKSPFQLPEHDQTLFYLQRLRDEAHRFAIGAHRTRRKNMINDSPLDEIPGIGPARKKALLHHFGSSKSIARAGVTDLQKVDGISKAFAQKIYDHFH